jgi:rSAM/selenodomain-associated transferase 2
MRTSLLPGVSAAIPTLNAGRTLRATLVALTGAVSEIVVADGGSIDGTPEVAASLGARVIEAGRGRGPQLAAAASAARGDWLLLLHADTRLESGWAEAARNHMGSNTGRAGYFRFALDSADPRARRLERMVAWRCRRLGLPYGDQGLLIHRELLAQVGGIRPLPLMEDVDLVRRLGHNRLAALTPRAITSAERWEGEGWRLRSARNLVCLSLYLAGMPPRVIARLYS